MTHHNPRLSRRSMFTIAAGSASALALGRVLTGSAHAAAPATKLIPESKLPPGRLVVPGDLKLDPETQVLAEKLLARAKQAVLDAATRPGAAAKGDKVAAAADKIVASLRSKRVTRLKAGLGEPAVAKEMARFGKLEVGKAHKFYAVEAEKLVVKKKQQKKVIKEKQEAPKWTPPLAARIEYQLNSVKCKNMTDGESGSDEILLGGHLITPAGVIKPIDRFKVSDDFDTGEVKRYDYSQCRDFPANMPAYLREAACPRGNPADPYEGRKLGATLLGLDKPWPATVGLLLVMGEEDPGGGFGAWMQDIYAALDDEIKQQLKDWGVEAGSAEAGEIGAAIGEALAYVVGEFLDWLVNLFDNPDDPIAAKSWTTRFNSPEMSSIRATVGDPVPAPAGVIASSMKRLDFVGDGGKYEVRLHWRVNA